MDNTLQKETARLKKEFIKANKEADKCTIKKCKHIKNIKNITAKLKKCNKEVKDYPPEKILEKMKVLNKCYETHKISSDDIFKIGQCAIDKCNDHVDKIESITSDLVYVSHPNGKELKELKIKRDELIEQEKLCKEQKCGHIYPLDKLKAENDKCNRILFSQTSNGKLLFTKNDKHSKCVTKYKIYEHNTAVSKCRKSKCKKVIKELEKIRDRMFKLQNDNSIKEMVKNLMKKRSKSKSRK